jgi:hypothetical protein
MIKSIAKKLAATIPHNQLERISVYSILKSNFEIIYGTQYFDKKELLWDNLLLDIVGREKKILLLEFGVYEGYSIRYFSNINKNINSLFFGFDSFEGLPEPWTSSHDKGHFSTKGIEPESNDQRISFVKGWFSDTLPPFIVNHKELFEDKDTVKIVHFDADLYSSTLFLLTQLWPILPEYYFIFDEFLGHETRALYNYLQSFPVNIDFLSHTKDSYGYPNQVCGKFSLRQQPEIQPI